MHGLDELRQAVASLEAALEDRERWLAGEAQEKQALQAEVEALRGIQHTIASGLDAAIARLKTVVGD